MSETDKNKETNKKDPEIMVLPSGLTLILDHNPNAILTSWRLEVNIGHVNCLKEEEDYKHQEKDYLLGCYGATPCF